MKAGLCTTCGGELDTNGNTCSKCRIKTNEYSKQYREFYQKKGICPICRKEKLFGTERRCLECRTKAYISSRKSKQKHRTQYRESFRIASKILYDERKSQGICPKCGKHQAKKGGVFCEYCLAKNRNWLRKARERKGVEIPRVERVAYGLCYICGKPLDIDKKICKSCYEKNIKSLQIHDTDNKSHPWRMDNRLIFQENDYEQN